LSSLSEKPPRKGDPLFSSGIIGSSQPDSSKSWDYSDALLNSEFAVTIGSSCFLFPLSTLLFKLLLLRIPL